MKELKFKGSGKLPTRGSKASAGLDLYAAHGATVHQGRVTQVHTDLSVEIPEGYYGRIAPRSGMAWQHGLDVLGGVIDSDYRGELIVLLTSHMESHEVHAEDKIAQLIIEKIETPEPVWAEDELSETERGAAGFGSTGR